MQRRFLFSMLACLLLLVSGMSAWATAAELPGRHVDTAYTGTGAADVTLAAGDNLQAALDRASPGDVIELTPGVVFEGPFILPAKTGNDYIVIRSAAADSAVLPRGQRVTPEQSQYMPVLVSGSAPVISAAPGAHHWRFIGVEFRPAGAADGRGLFERLKAPFAINTAIGGDGIYLKNLIDLGSDVTDPADSPHHVIFDRCYIHGDARSGARRGIAMNGRDIAVINSWMADFKEVGADSQAILGWNGAGPFKIANNHLEGAGENVMFGGATPAIPGLVPADIEIRGNHFTKPLSWKHGHPDFAGIDWSVKNLLELKNARRVLIDGNLFEYNWPHAQNGFAILFTVRNEGGAVPWATVADVRFTNNVLRHIGAGINILGHDDNGFPSDGTRDLHISNNLFSSLGGAWGNGTLLQMLDGVDGVVFSGNTAFNTGRIIMSEGRAHRGFTFSGNLVMHNDYGIIGTGTGPGKDTLDRYFPDATLRANILVGAPAAAYPGGNSYPGSATVPEGTGGVDRVALCEALSAIERHRLCGGEAAH